MCDTYLGRGLSCRMETGELAGPSLRGILLWLCYELSSGFFLLLLETMLSFSRDDFSQRTRWPFGRFYNKRNINGTSSAMKLALAPFSYAPLQREPLYDRPLSILAEILGVPAMGLITLELLASWKGYIIPARI